MATKTLRVCLSKDLPAVLERSEDFLYFTYDDLHMYSGQNDIDQNFAISETMPDEPVNGMIYLLSSDGTAHRKVDYTDVTIATIEDESQIELLKKAGTTFYINSAHRYFDSQQRTLTLPFTNGVYELSAATLNNQVYDNDTILKYNEDNERFEIYGPQSEEFIDYSKPFRGGETGSVKVTVNGPKITADVKISSAIDNIIRAASDGLYVKATDKVDKDTFNQFAQELTDFRGYAKTILDKANAEIADLRVKISEETIKNDEIAYLETKYEGIETALKNYQSIVDSLDAIESEVLEYASNEITKARSALQASILENAQFQELDDSASEYTQEINYYEKSEEFVYPELTEDEVQVILGAVSSFIIYEDNP